MTPRALDAKWYDKFYEKARGDPRSAYAQDARRCGYANIWLRALDWIGGSERILDLGCGPGQFAQLAIEAGKTYVRGIDFSRSAIIWARQRNPSHAKAFDAYRFDSPHALACAYDVVVLFEVLEHVDDDVGLLKKLGPGVHVIFSVPNFGFTSHVRKFMTKQEIEARYGSVLDLLDMHTEDTGKHRLWLFNAKRKSK